MGGDEGGTSTRKGHFSMTRTVFYGFGGFVGRLRGPTECDWWADDPASLGWAQNALISVDLAKTPSAVRAGKLGVNDIQVDDHRTEGGLTTIGPRWPSGTAIGEVWLADTYFNSLGNKPPRQCASAGNDAYDYELTSILYWDGDLAGRRFRGYHARIVRANGPLAFVEVWNGGTARGKQRPAGTWWLDLAAVAHPVDPIATEISLAGQQEGALFLDTSTTSTMTISSVKRPPGWGGDSYP
jgi:hypothetical protein